jgi:hypothetical protein
VRNYRHNNPNYRIAGLIRTRLWKALQLYGNGKIYSSKKYGVNYTAIINHLGPKPDDGKEYHIDHIRPLCSFDLRDLNQIKLAFAPENHQWLIAEENWKFGGRFK